MAPGAPEAAQLRAFVEAVQEPDLLRSLGELGMVRDVTATRRQVSVDLVLPVATWPVRDELTRLVGEALRAAGASGDARVEIGVMTEEERRELLGRLARPAGGEPGAVAQAGGHTHRVPPSPGAPPAPLVAQQGSPNRYLTAGTRTRVIGISSGKGGVGKSSVAVNLAVALAARGNEVGLLDADVYGFSVPKMLGVDRDPEAIDELLVPPVVHGVRCLSMGFFVDDDQPVVWRGPMLHKTLEQFLLQAYWGEPDYLLIDMPPGTGDVTLSLGQYLPRTEILVVTTPQPAAQRVAQRSALAAKRLNLSVRGVIENMSWFRGDDGKRYELFGSGGGRLLAESLGVSLLGEVPLVPAIREGADAGVPVLDADPASEASKAFGELADALVALGPARIYRSELKVR